MKIMSRLILLTLILALAPALLGACGGSRKSSGQLPVNATGTKKSDSNGSSAVSDKTNPEACLKETDIAEAVGFEVRKIGGGYGRGFLCSYEATDGRANVSYMELAASQSEQLLDELRSSAKPLGAEVETINVGERGYAYGSNSGSRGIAVAGNRVFSVEVSPTGMGPRLDAKKDAVIELLRKLIA
jgi:hypothetical protein